MAMQRPLQRTSRAAVAPPHRYASNLRSSASEAVGQWFESTRAYHLQDFDQILRHYDFPSEQTLRIHDELAEV